jgi:NhaA family Na+:H+ antiporter
MTLFFFVVGLEIKRELLVGELSSVRKAILPIAAAIGGLVCPALVFYALNPAGTPYTAGWGIPTVTDIAFAIGILAILGSRAPLGLKVFLTALAIADDLGAILMIALFYSAGIQAGSLLTAGVVLLGAFVLNRMEVDRPLPYAVLGIVLWASILQSGIHPTIAGVLLALMVPAQSRIDARGFHIEAQAQLERFRQAGVGYSEADRFMLTNEGHQSSVHALDRLVDAVETPLQQFEHALQPWVNFIILPLFALANAGVQLKPELITDALTNSLTLGIILGLFFGKQIGITLFAWLSVRLKLADLPSGVSWRQIHGASVLGGIGFTMSVFITLLAFTQPEQIAFAKLGILIASGLSAVIGCLLLARAKGTIMEEALVDE